MRNLLILLFCVFSLGSTAEAGKLYKWKDKDGTIKYSQQPPAEGEYEVIDKRNRSSLGKEVSQPEFGVEPPELTPEEIYIKSTKQNCDAAKLNLSILTGQGQVRSTDGTLLSEEERKKQVALAEKQIGVYCGKADSLEK